MIRVRKTDDRELDSIRRIFGILRSLEGRGPIRVMRYVWDRMGEEEEAGFTYPVAAGFIEPRFTAPNTTESGPLFESSLASRFPEDEEVHSEGVEPELAAPHDA
jgi:hypothetical protein